MIIRVKNTLDQKAEYTYLTSDTAIGAGTFPVKNINTGAANWAIQFGKSGEEKSEILLITSSAPSGTTLVSTGTARFDHPTDTPVYFIKYDQVVFKRSTSGTAGTATAISSGTVSITPDGTVTIFDDTSGATTYGYKACFRNSVTGDLSTDSDWLTPSGFNFYMLAKLRDRVKSKLYSANYLRDDDQVDDWINEWYETMTNKAISVNQDYSMGTVDVSFGSDGLGTITSTDFKEIRRFEVTYNGTDYYLATKKSGIDYLPNETFNSTHPYFIYKGDTTFLIKPENSGGTARLAYYKTNSVLTNDTDSLPVSMRNYTKTFVDYALAQAYYMDGKDNLGDRFNAAALNGLEMFVRDITPRSKTGPQYITLIEAIDADDTKEFI